jgi:hypothetical protein
MLDDTDDDKTKHRIRRRKASSLSDEFTHKGVHAALEQKTLQVQQAARPVAPAQPATASGAPKTQAEIREQLFAKLATVHEESRERVEQFAEEFERNLAAPRSEDVRTRADAMDLETPASPDESAVPVVVPEEAASATPATAPVADVSQREPAPSATATGAEGHDRVQTADPSAPAAATAPYRSGMRGVRGRDEEWTAKFAALAEIDEDYAERFARGEEPDADFERRVTEIKLGAVALEKVGSRLHPAVRDNLERRNGARARARELFEASRGLEGNEFKAARLKAARARDQIADGNYSETRRLLAVDQRSHEVALRGRNATDAAVELDRMKRAADARQTAEKPVEQSQADRLYARFPDLKQLREERAADERGRDSGREL